MAFSIQNMRNTLVVCILSGIKSLKSYTYSEEQAASDFVKGSQIDVSDQKFCNTCPNLIKVI